MPSNFIAIATDPFTKPARCVDGRADPNSRLGVQMLGGSLHPIVIWCIAEGLDINEVNFSEGLSRLQSAGFATGFHNDDHAHTPLCGCGFCDRLDEILAIAGTKTKISSKVEFFQLPLLDSARSSGANIEKVVGSHEEGIAFINTVSGTTFDTLGAVSAGWQAFNLDLWAVVQQVQVAFGIEPEQTKEVSLALYQATEIVLVENKGKPKLAISEITQ